MDPSLQSICTGVHAHSTINVDEAVTAGDMILTQMNRTTPAEYPLLLFQRITTVMQSSDDLELAFKHELCSYPPALFDSSLLLHITDKPALADAIWKICDIDVSQQIS